MSGTQGSRIRAFALAAVLAGAAAGLYAQAGPRANAVETGALSGRLTDIHSTPLAGITLILRNQETGAEINTTTGRNGAYRFSALEPGAYSLRVENQRLGQGELEDIEVAAGNEAHVQAAMEFTAALPVGQPAPSALEVAAHEVTPHAEIQTETVVADSAIPALPLQTVTIPSLRLDSPAPIPEKADESPARPPTAQMATTTVPSPVPAKSSPQPAVVTATGSQSSITASLLVAPVRPPIAATAIAAGGSSAALGEALLRGVVAGVAKEQQLKAAQTDATQPGVATPAVTTFFSGEQLQSLPTSGRRWEELFLGTPTASAGQSSGQLVLRGAGQDEADTTIDGASTRLAFGAGAGSAPALAEQDPSGGRQDGMGRGWAGGHGVAMSSAAIREVQTVAGNVESEGAHEAGGRAGVTTQSGGNQLHGQGSFFDRQNTWGARNPFTQWVRNTGTATAPIFTAVPFTPPDHETAWSFGVGSRIRRDRLFWFAALDGNRRNDPGVASLRNATEFFAQPSNAQMQLLSAQLQLSSTNPVAEGLAAYWPMMESLAGLLGPAQRTSAQWVGFARLDWQAAERHHFTVEGTGANWSAPGGGLTRISESYGNRSFGLSQARREWLLARWEAFLTSNLLATTQASAGRDVLSARPEAPSAFEQEFLGSGWNSYGQLPQIVVDSRYGFTIGNPSRFGQGSYPDEKMIRAQEMVDWVHGRLLVKSGFEFDHDSDATTLLRNGTGSYTYSKVQDFISDALVFEQYGADPDGWQGLRFTQHNCSPISASLTGTVPCYSYFSQMIGPNYWQVSTNDLAAYVSTQWQLNKFAVLSAGLRWEREQLPPPIETLANPALTQQMPNQPAPLLMSTLPNLGNEWGPRVSMALGRPGRWPVMRLGYGMYFGRLENAMLETALTQTGSLNGDLYFFIRPTDGYTSATGMGNAPMFPNVLSGPPASVVTPGAVGFAPNFRSPEVHQALASVEQTLPGRMTLTAAAVLSLGRRLPVSVDTNIDSSINPQTITYAVKDPTGEGPIKSAEVTVPFFATWPAGASSCASQSVTRQCGRLNPQYQQVVQIQSRANSTYEAAMVRLTRSGPRGLMVHAHYTYAHAMDWNPGGNTLMPGNNVLDPRPQYFDEEYGTSNLDIRHSAAAMMIYEAPRKLRGTAGRLGNGWALSGIGNFHSGLPYSMRITGSLPKCAVTTGVTSCTAPPGVTATAGEFFLGLGPSLNGSGGDSRYSGLPRNSFRYPQAWKFDLRLAKKFELGEMRELELLAESFNLFNHQNVTEIETAGYSIESGTSSSPPQLCYLAINPVTGGDSCQTPSTSNPGPFTPAFGTPLNINATDFYRERQMQFGARLRF